MIEQIYSNINNNILLASVLRHDDIIGRVDASSTEEILQVSAITLPKNKTVKPHSHKLNTRTILGTQESWIVINGTLQITVYDTDHTIVTSISLREGDCFVLYRGGHTLNVISDGAKIFEIKNGPYYGTEFDAEPITNN